MRTRSGLFVVTLAGALVVPASTPRAQGPAPAMSQGPAPAIDEDVVLAPTPHSRLPADLSLLWLAPGGPARTGRPATGPGRTEAARKAGSDLAAAVKLEADGDFAKALPILLRPGVQQGTLGHYAEYFRGLVELRLARPDDARQTFRALAAKAPVGYLVEAAALREAECDEALGDQAAAAAIYDRLSHTKTIAPDDVLMRLGKAAKAAGNAEAAASALSRVVYEFPFSSLATDAAAALDGLPLAPIVAGGQRYKLEIGRAERLFGAKRYAQARAAFEPLRPLSQGDDRELVNLRLAECEYFLKRPRNARDGVRPYIDGASRQGEALYFYAIATRELGDRAEYLRIVRRLVDEFSLESWAEDALNHLATRYIIENDDVQANATFRELYARFPTGRYAERAAWKIGWSAYRNGRYADTVRAFESAAANFPRSDYRPPWLYWSGRAHASLDEQTLAEARYTLVATDYLNSYYGRLAVVQLGGRAPQRRLVVDAGTRGRPGSGGDAAVSVAPQPPNESVVRALLDLELYDQALDELHYAQQMWGSTPAIQATIAWVDRQRGDLRAGINAMKRAYPQYMAAGGEQLPDELLKVLFPVNYWPLIQRYSAERQLDPYMIAALIAQESTFAADAKSSANAYGLMQLLPSTARPYARALHLTKRFSIGLLTTAEANIRLGTAYFADLIRRFGDAHYALATYNAGPNRVARWISERPGIARDEFIDDIPFPETQNYVKRILGTAEDYRRLYGGGAAVAVTAPTASRPQAAAGSRGAKAKAAAPPRTPTKARKPAVVKRTRKAT